MVTDHHPIPEVSINPRRRAGEPCITGSRIPVAIIAGLVNDGYPPRRIKYWYHGVTADVARKVTEWYNQQETAT
jgi:uncharacterized protein (DUF433 family)